MAAITSAVIGIAGLGLSAYQVIDGANRQKKSQRESNNYERQELNTAFENVQISTMGSDLLREENARTSANLVDASQLGGARTVIGAVPRVVAATNEINQTAAKMLDDQVRQREYAIAGDNARIEGITENRDIANIAGLSSQIDAGRQDMWNGISSGLSSAAYLGRGLKELKDTDTGTDTDNTSTSKIGSSVVSGARSSSASLLDDWQMRTPSFKGSGRFYTPNIDTSKGIDWQNQTPYFKTPVSNSFMF